METNFTPAVTTELETQLTGLQQRAKEIAITSHDDVVKANDFLKEVKAFTKYVEEQRTALTKPLNDIVSEINERAKKFKGPGDIIEKEIKDLILGFNESETKRLQVVENAIQQKIKDINACNSLEELEKYPAPTDVPEDGRIYVARVARKNAIIEAGRIASGVKPSVEVEKERIKEDKELKEAQAQVVTPAPAPTVSGVRTTTHAVIVNVDLIPRAYMVADLKAIEAALKNGAIVPGAKLEEKKTLAVR